MTGGFRSGLIGLLIWLEGGQPGWADPTVALIMDDLGNQLTAGRRVLALPGPVACSFLPHTRYAAALAEQAHQGGKDVLLHLPMASVDGRPLGPGGIGRSADQAEIHRVVQEDLASLPHVIGINNHMGSWLTQQRGLMTALMQDLHRRGGLFFVDSRTIHTTVALDCAQEVGLPALARDLFLDDDRSPASIRRQFMVWLDKAQQNGHALAIAHPYSTTLAVLEQLLPQLSRLGVNWVPLGEIVAQRTATPP